MPDNGESDEQVAQSTDEQSVLDRLTRRGALQMGAVTVGSGLLMGTESAEAADSSKPNRRGACDPISSFYNVTKFGACGDSETDDSEAIQSAIDAAVSDGGGIVYIPPGTYNVDKTLTVSGDHIAIVGAGKGSIIRGTFEEGNIIYAGGPEPADGVRNITIRDLEITASVEKTSGAALFGEHAQRFLVENVFAERQGALNPNLYNSFYFRYFDSCVLSNVFGVCTHKSVTIHGKENQAWGAGFWLINGSRLMNGPPLNVPEDSVGFHIGGSCGGIAIEDTDIIVNERNILINSELSGAINRELFINQCWVDRSISHGIDIGTGGVHLLHLNNTWIASSGADDAESLGYPEANNLNVQEDGVGRVIANGCRIFNAFGSGIVAESGQFTISGCDIFANGRGADGGHGVALLGEGIEDTSVVGNTITDNGSNELGEGVHINEGVNNYVVAANIIRNNGTDQLIDEGGPNKAVDLNVT